MSELPKHEIALIVAGKAYWGWTDLSVGGGIDAASGTFRLKLAAKERTMAEDWPLEDGATCEVQLAGETLITGYIDVADRILEAEERGIEITGRDKTADLVDCGAVHKPGSWRGQKLETIAAELVKPFSVELELSGSTGAAFKRFALQQGETVFAAIERMARYRGLAIWSPGDGKLHIGNPDTGERSGRIEEGVNLKRCRATRDTSERYSDYIVKGQASGDDKRHGKDVAQIKGSATDAEVKRYRPLLIIGEEQSDAASLKKRAEWEAAVRSGRANPVSVTVPGWLTDAGKPWKPGARCALKVPSCKVEGDLLVETVEFTRDATEGTLTTLKLVPPAAWTQLAEAEPKQ